MKLCLLVHRSAVGFGTVQHCAFTALDSSCWLAAKRSTADKKASAKKGNTGSAPKADYSKEEDESELQVEKVAYSFHRLWLLVIMHHMKVNICQTQAVYSSENMMIHHLQ